MFRDGKEYEDGQFTENASGGLKQSAEATNVGVPILGIDLGSRKIRAVAGWVEANGRVDIIGVKETDSNGINKGIITDQDITVDAIRAALDELSIFLNTEISKVFVSVSGNQMKRFTFGSSFIRKSAEQSITSDELEGYIKQTMEQVEIMPGERIIHFYPQEFIVDSVGGINEPIGLTGKEIEIELQVVTGQIANIQNIINCLGKAGLEIIGFIPSYMASSDAVLSGDDRKEGVALVDIGSSATQVVIYNEGLLKYSSIIPFGSGIITEDIKDGLFVIRKEAELLKIKAGSALSDKIKGNEFSTIRLKGDPKEVSVKNLSRIIQARVEEILEMVMLEIKNSGLDKNLKNGIVLTGGGALLKNLELLVSRATGFPARIGYPVERLVGGMDMELRNPAYSTSVGLLLKGYQVLKNGNPLNSETIKN